MIDVTTKEARKWILHLNPDWNPSPMIVALFSHCDTLEQRVERMQAVVDAASLLIDAIEDLAGKGCMTAKSYSGGETTIRTITDDRLFVEVLRNANLVKTKLDAAREGKR